MQFHEGSPTLKQRKAVTAHLDWLNGRMPSEAMERRDLSHYPLAQWAAKRTKRRKR